MNKTFKKFIDALDNWIKEAEFRSNDRHGYGRRRYKWDAVLLRSFKKYIIEKFKRSSGRGLRV